MTAPLLDLIAIGRSSVDLYGQQVGGRLEDMASFSKAVGGCPTNIAIGTARLGLKSGLITRVGDEHMGRFIREQCGREGVSLEGIHTDADRLTALVILGIRDENFPLIFYRSDCADAALCEADIDETFIASARAIVVTGTHFAQDNTAAAQRLAMRFARKHGRKIVLDIDYRPNLWGLAGHGAGEERYVASKAVSARLQAILHDCDLIVGTEEELMIAGGCDEPLDAIRAVRALTSALIVCKRGPMGCVVFSGLIPDTIEGGERGPGFPVEVFNVLGAGDAFMSGFLRGYLRDEPLATCCAYANACGAFAVSRLLCSSEYPTFAELQHFLTHGSSQPALRRDASLTHLHWASTRHTLARPDRTATLMALAIDHRAQMETIADAVGAPYGRIAPFKRLAVAAAARVAQGRDGFGVLLDSRYGGQAFTPASDQRFWIGRPVELPGSRPLDFEGDGSLAAMLAEWPVSHTIKCLCFYHPDDAPELRHRQERELLRLSDAARKLGRDLLVEIIATKHGAVDEQTLAQILARLYELGVKPDWWKLEPQTSVEAWDNIAAVIQREDKWCRGIVMLGLEASEYQLITAFALAAKVPMVKGFAVGRTIFAEPARAWLANEIDDASAVDAMSATFGRLVAAWQHLKVEQPT